MEGVRPQSSSRAHRLRRDLIACTTDGCLYSVMVGIGESYLALFMLAAGFGKVVAGLIATVPLLVGSVLGLLSPFGVRRIGTHRRFIIFCATLQGASFVPLAIMAFTGRVNLWAAFAAATVYWGSGTAAGSAWNTWIGVLVPRRIRSNYFGRRATLCHVSTIVGLASGGLLLEVAGAGRAPVSWFALLFGIAALCRFVCLGCFAAQTETGPVPKDHREVGAGELLSRLRHGRDGRFIIYMIFMQIGVQIAQPFLVPFVREGLKFNYIDYLLLISGSFIAKAVFQPLWGAFAQRRGALRLLWIGGTGIVPLSALWILPIFVAMDPRLVFWYLLASQLVSGALWAAYEQAVLLLMFDTIKEEERTSLWSAYNVGNAAAMVGGSLLGAWLLGESQNPGAYWVTFILSVAVRMATVIYLIRAHDLLEPPQPIILEAASLQPGAGTIDRPILATMNPDTDPRR